MKQQPRRIVAARPHFLVFLGPAHDLAQLLQHEVGDGCVLAALDGALELPHQQRLRLRRELGEIVPQPLGRCLAHAPDVDMRVSCGQQSASTANLKSARVKKSFSSLLKNPLATRDAW